MGRSLGVLLRRAEMVADLGLSRPWRCFRAWRRPPPVEGSLQVERQSRLERDLSPWKGAVQLLHLWRTVRSRRCSERPAGQWCYITVCDQNGRCPTLAASSLQVEFIAQNPSLTWAHHEGADTAVSVDERFPGAVPTQGVMCGQPLACTPLRNGGQFLLSVELDEHPSIGRDEAPRSDRCFAAPLFMASTEL